MTDRSVKGLPNAGAILPSSSFRDRLLGEPGRVRRAFLVGACLVGLGLGSLQAPIAAGLLSRSGSPLAFLIKPQQNHEIGAISALSIRFVQVDPDAAKGRVRTIADAGAARPLATSMRHSVCVRTCDGYFFPIGPVASEADWRRHEADCAGLCPDAKTQLFVEPAGSARIEDAVSRDGAPYTALATAFANRVSADKSCSCHRHPGETFPLADDFTLRSGDSVMTASGILVFKGSGHMPFAQSDFVHLAQASLPRDKRAALAALERATLPNLRETVASIAAPLRSEIAFAAPATTERSDRAALNRTIHFVEPMTSARN